MTSVYGTKVNEYECLIPIYVMDISQLVISNS